MLKSEEFHNLIKRFFILSIFLFLLCILFSFINVKLYQTNLQKQDAKVFAQIVEIYPELEEEIAEALQSETYDLELGKKYTERYGISSVDPSLMTQTIVLTTSGTFFFTLILITVTYLLHLRRIYKKLDYINNYINDVLNDKFFLNIKEYQEGAFSNLKNDIYKITNKLKYQQQQLLQDKRYLESTLSDISHQIKTPLTSMYVINNLLEDSKLDPKIRSEFIRKNELQLERIEWLVSSLLKLSRLESGTIKLKQVKVKVIDLIEKSLETLKIPIELKKQILIIEGLKNITINCDINWTREAFTNIIKNAHEHTLENGSITISWSDNPIYTEILIKDTGEGIDPEDINHIFERFYKGSHNTKESIGIGLNMSYQIITKQNATIEVESQKKEGTTFIIRFFKNKI